MEGTFFEIGNRKLPSNATKEWSGTIRDLRRKGRKLEKKIKELVDWGADPKSDPDSFLHRFENTFPLRRFIMWCDSRCKMPLDGSSALEVVSSSWQLHGH